MAVQLEQDEERNWYSYLKTIIIIACTIGIVLLLILSIFAAAYCKLKRKWPTALKKALNDQLKRIWIKDEEVAVVPSVHARRLGRDENPEVRDKFGLDKIDPVTAGEGMNLAVMARPRVTDGFPRSRSEELMDTLSSTRNKEGESGQ